MNLPFASRLSLALMATSLVSLIFCSQSRLLHAVERSNIAVGPGAAEPASPAEWYGLGVRPTEKRSPDEERAGFHLPPGFEIDLIASEPQIAKPLNLAFDHRGRIWFTETVEYPYPAKAGEPSRDCVKVLEDKDGDGQFESVTKFADGLNIPIGILPYGEGAIVFSIPNLLYLRDTDGDGVCDQRDVLLGPFDTSRDTHGMVNSLRQGPDGWIYACHGFSNQSSVSGRDGHKVHMTSGNTFRFRPDGSRVETFTAGQVNPFGMTEDRWGVLYSADCHSKPLTCLIHNACYPSFGRPDDGLGFFPSMMEHLHESTAISGISLYDADQFPAEYRDQFYSGNVMTSRINRDQRVQQGATIVAKQAADFLTSDDPWFRPVDIQLGPDGALYVADFYNRIIGHYEVPLEHPDRDRTSGRIWRIRYSKPDVPPLQLKLLDDSGDVDLSGCIAELASANASRRRLALVQLQTAAAKEPALVRALLESQWSQASPLAKTNLVWLARMPELQSLSIVRDALQDPDALVRRHALAALTATSEQNDEALSSEILQQARIGLTDTEPMVAAAAAELLAIAGTEQDATLLATAILRAGADPMLKARLRIALRDRLQQANVDVAAWFHQQTDTEQRNVVLDVLLGTTLPSAAEVLTEQILSLDPSGAKFTQWVQFIGKHGDDATFARLVEALRMQPQRSPQAQVELLAILKTAAGESRLDALKPWADDLLVQLIAATTESLSANENHLVWSDSAGSPWPFEDRNLNRSSDNGPTRLTLQSSFPLGETYRGVLRSQSFAAGESLSFWLAGHNGIPDQPDAGLNRIRLIESASSKVLCDTLPPRNDVAQWITWDTSRWQTTQVHVELIDGDQNGAYAWIAAGGFSDPRLNSSSSDTTWKSLLSLLQDYRSTSRLAELKPLLADSRLGTSRQLQLLSVVSQITKHAPVQAVVFAMQSSTADAAATDFIHQATSEELAHPSGPLSAAFQDVCWQQLKRLSAGMPQSTQTALARKLAMNRETAVPLLDAIDAGWITRDCLRDKDLDAALSNLLTGDERERLVAMKSSLDSSAQEHTELRTQIANLLRDTPADIDHGKQVFEKSCAACHQIKGAGALVGPQLDGVGGRGVERLLEDILLPDRNVDKSFRTTAYLLDDGTVLVGLFQSQDGSQLQMVDNAGKKITISLDSIESQMTSDRSLMPDGFAQSLDATSLRDLIAYLQSIAAPARPMVD